mgnify:CR=1 FL=1
METLQRMANRGSISTGPYEIDNSVKLEPDNSEYFQRAASGSDGSLTTWTFSLWLKRTELSHACIFYSQGGTGRVRFESDDTFSFMYKSGHELTTSRRFRDTSAWYHIVIAVDTTQGTASNRIKIYINGVQETMSGTQPDEDEASDFGEFGSVTAQLGQFSEGSYYFAGYMAEFYWIDGTAEAPTAFGEFDEDTGIWKPKKYTGSFGSEGAYLDFADSGNLGDDESGNGNDYAEQNIAAADQATDTPTNNFCVLSTLWTYAHGNTISEGSTKIYGAANDWGGGKASFGLTAGKWYWEIEQLAAGNTFMGLQTDGDSNIGSGNAQSHNISVVFYTDGTLQYSGGSETTTSASNSIGANSIVGFALDLDSGTQTIKIYLDGSLITTFGSSGTCNLSTYNIEDTTVFPFVALYDRTVNMNFGGYTVTSISSAQADANGYGTFEHAPPTGYYAVCTKNLSEFGG